MPANDWPTGGAVKTDLDEEIVQGAVSSDDSRKGLVYGIQDAKDEGDEAGAASLTALLHEADRRRRVQDRVRAAAREVDHVRNPTRRQAAGRKSA